MNQPSNEELISAWIDGELDPETARTVEQLVADSPPLRELAEQLRQLSQQLRNLPRYSLTRDLRPAVMQAIDARVGSPTSPALQTTASGDSGRPSRGASWRWLGGALAVAAALTGIVIWLPDAGSRREHAAVAGRQTDRLRSQQTDDERTASQGATEGFLEERNPDVDETALPQAASRSAGRFGIRSDEDGGRLAADDPAMEGEGAPRPAPDTDILKREPAAPAASPPNPTTRGGRRIALAETDDGQPGFPAERESSPADLPERAAEAVEMERLAPRIAQGGENMAGDAQQGAAANRGSEPGLIGGQPGEQQAMNPAEGRQSAGEHRSLPADTPAVPPAMATPMAAAAGNAESPTAGFQAMEGDAGGQPAVRPFVLADGEADVLVVGALPDLNLRGLLKDLSDDRRDSPDFFSGGTAEGLILLFSGPATDWAQLVEQLKVRSVSGFTMTEEDAVRFLTDRGVTPLPWVQQEPPTESQQAMGGRDEPGRQASSLFLVGRLAVGPAAPGDGERPEAAAWPDSMGGGGFGGLAPGQSPESGSRGGGRNPPGSGTAGQSVPHPPAGNLNGLSRYLYSSVPSAVPGPGVPQGGQVEGNSRKWIIVLPPAPGAPSTPPLPPGDR